MRRRCWAVFEGLCSKELMNNHFILHSTDLIRWPISNLLPPRSPRYDPNQRGMTLTVQLALSVQVHDIDLDDTTRVETTNTKVEP